MQNNFCVLLLFDKMKGVCSQLQKSFTHNIYLLYVCECLCVNVRFYVSKREFFIKSDNYYKTCGYAPSI